MPRAADPVLAVCTAVTRAKAASRRVVATASLRSRESRFTASSRRSASPLVAQRRTAQSSSGPRPRV